MERYEQFLEWVRLLALFTAVFVADVLLKTLAEHKMSSTVAALLLGIVAITALHLAELAAVHAFEHWDWLKRHLLGSQWIEGMWFDKIIGHDECALVTISIDRGRVRIHGEQFDAAGNVSATWEDHVTEMDGSTLRGIYRSSQFRSSSPAEVSGYSMYVFTGPPNEPPRFYSGFFVDGSADGRRCQLRGFRIIDGGMLSRLRDPQLRRQQVAVLLRQSEALSDTRQAARVGGSELPAEPGVEA